MRPVRRVFQVDGRPFFPLGGQVHNSSGYKLSELETAWQALEAIDANTVEIPVYWSQVEPVEGEFDFSVLDDLLAGARAHGLKLILLWFGTWKNGQMEYAPNWVKTNPARFTRVTAAAGHTLAVLSSHCAATQEADKRAFTALMRAIRDKDADEGTVIAVQIENEPGILHSDRDYGREADEVFYARVPEAVLNRLAEAPGSTVHAAWQAAGSRSEGNWPELFGYQAGEFMTAWSIASYIDALAAAGKAVYELPMTINAWLGEQGFRLAGNYPAGGPVMRVLDLYKWATPHVEIIAPDIYLGSSAAYRYQAAAYHRPDNPLFVPESGRSGSNARHIFYALADHDAIGYFCFGVESMLDRDGQLRPESRAVAESFQAVRRAIPLLLEYQGTGRIHAIVQEEHATEQYLELGDYIGWVRYADSDARYPRGYLYPPPEGGFERARGLVVQAGQHEFYLVGGPFRILFKKKPASDAELSAQAAAALLSDDLPDYLLVEEGEIGADGTWQAKHWRNGDEVTGGIWVDMQSGLVRAILTH